MLMKVRHYNKIQAHINDTFQDDKLSNSREVYCKRLHIVKEPDTGDCVNCLYFGGLMQGHGHECVWNDDVRDKWDKEQVIPFENRYKEMLRVSKLIDKGILQKG